MKKSITNLVLLMAFFISILVSCNKAETQEQLVAADRDNNSTENTTKPGHHQPHHNSCFCPAAVATATGISYSLNFVSDPQQVGISADLSYTNPGPQGTFRIILLTANGNVDSISVVTAGHTDPGQPGIIHLQYWVPYGSFPCTLQVNGRPANLHCDIRSKMIFTIENDVSK